MIPPSQTGIDLLFLDTAPVMYHMERNPAQVAKTDAVFRGIDRVSLAAVTSPVTLAECLVVPYRAGDTALADQFARRITAGTHTTFWPIGDQAAMQAAGLRARYGITLTDALQLAVAIEAGCDGFLTNDAGPKRVDEIRALVLDELTL